MKGPLSRDEWWVRWLPERMRDRSRRRIRARLTTDGIWFLVVTVGVMLAAVNTGNNLLYLVLASLLATLLVSNVLAEWNLRGLHVGRRLPVEVFASQAAAGAFIVENRRRLGKSWTLRLAEEDPETGAVIAEARLLQLAAGAQADVGAGWMLPERGQVQLRRLRLEGGYPFGLMRRWRLIELPAELLVYAMPIDGAVSRGHGGRGNLVPDPRQRSRDGDLIGLREYVPGDPIRDVHWPTTARTGQAMVVQREGQHAQEVEILVDPRSPRELAISRATGEVLRQFFWGRAVGLSLDGRRHAPRGGQGWRRHLLTLLALASEQAEEGR